MPEEKADAWLDWGFCLLAALDTPLLDCTMSSLQVGSYEGVSLLIEVAVPGAQEAVCKPCYFREE